MVDSERARMLRGDLYLATDPELVTARTRARRLSARYNATAPDQEDERQIILRELLGHVGTGVGIEPPFFCDYGTQIELGDGVFLNMNCVLLDPAPIRIGPYAMLGPAVQLYTATHPLEPRARVSGPEMGKPISIGTRVWIGGATIVCPGVSIGNDTTIGAGSVVVRDIPPGVLAVGNPCRVVRTL
jgi:maltose O-acetyltransferase